MLSGYKTYITGVVAIVGAVGAYLAGDATVANTAQLVKIGRASCRERV